MHDQTFDNVSINELECPYCQDQIDNFQSHVNGGFGNEEKFSCNNCDLVLSNGKCLSSHKQMVHNEAMKVFSCETCNIDFSSKEFLFIHKNHDIHLQKGLKYQNDNMIIKLKLMKVKRTFLKLKKKYLNKRNIM